jgi:hypothetical protein
MNFLIRIGDQGAEIALNDVVIGSEKTLFEAHAFAQGVASLICEEEDLPANITTMLFEPEINAIPSQDEIQTAFQRGLAKSIEIKIT